MSGTSEEKSLPASDKKLREARGKGQVSKSQDLVAGTVMLASTLYLAFVLQSSSWTLWRAAFMWIPSRRFGLR
jgi:flagellar biosynthesis protein FlhB